MRLNFLPEVQGLRSNQQPEKASDGMAYGIMRTNKQKMSDCRGIQAEANRSPDKPMNFPGSDIDWNRTKDNIYLVHSDDFRKSIKDICAEHGIKTIRKDAVAFLDSFFGASPEFFETADPETVRKYFDDCLHFAERHLGVVFNARIHVDEGTPHLTLQSVPIVQNEDGSFSLSAKRLMGNRTDYHNRQELFYTEVSVQYGFDPCEKQEDRIEKRSHLENLDFKLKMRTEELEKVSDELEVKTADLEQKTQELENVNAEVKLKTGVLETAFDKISSFFSVFFQYSTQIYRSFVGRIHDFIDKVYEKKILSSHDFTEANMKPEPVSPSADDLVFPVTSAGDRLTWHDGEFSPVYRNLDDNSFLPYGSVNQSGEIEHETGFEWSDRFDSFEVDEYTIPAEVEISDAVFELSQTRNDIAKVLGMKDDIEIVNEQIDRYDSPTPDQPDNDEIDNDDVGID